MATHATVPRPVSKRFAAFQYSGAMAWTSRVSASCALLLVLSVGVLFTDGAAARGLSQWWDLPSRQQAAAPAASVATIALGSQCDVNQDTLLPLAAVGVPFVVLARGCDAPVPARTFSTHQ